MSHPEATKNLAALRARLAKMQALAERGATPGERTAAATQAQRCASEVERAEAEMQRATAERVARFIETLYRTWASSTQSGAKMHKSKSRSKNRKNPEPVEITLDDAAHDQIEDLIEVSVKRRGEKATIELSIADLGDLQDALSEHGEAAVLVVGALVLDPLSTHFDADENEDDETADEDDNTEDSED